MWKLKNFSIKPIASSPGLADLSSSLANQLYSNEIQLINAIEWIDWGDDPLQFIICNCGIMGCRDQNWVSIRQAGQIAVIMPAFEKIHDVPDYMQNDYRAPAYLNDRGILYLEPEDYQKLHELAGFPSFDSLKPLSGWEITKILQFEAPYQVLGDYLKVPQLLPEIIMASSEGSFIEQTPKLMQLIRDLEQSRQPIRLHKVDTQTRVIAFYLDISGLPEWEILSFEDSTYSLYLQPGYIVEL